jgi:hypothetical protein
MGKKFLYTYKRVPPNPFPKRGAKPPRRVLKYPTEMYVGCLDRPIVRT